jgi:hypothetical protein
MGSGGSRTQSELTQLDNFLVERRGREAGTIEKGLGQQRVGTVEGITASAQINPVKSTVLGGDRLRRSNIERDVP